MGPIYSIILAGGSGTRMGTAGRHKVCFDIDGRPAINRALDTYTACGIGPHVVVVGALADQVMTTVSQGGYNAIYAYQAEQRGTGHAAKQGARILQQIGHKGPVLVVAGDVIVQPGALRKLLAVFEETHCDLALMVGPRQYAPTAGRVVIDEAGTALTIVETRDISRRRALVHVRAVAEAALEHEVRSNESLRQAILAILTGEIADERKAGIAFGGLWDRLHANEPPDPAALLSLVPEEATHFTFADAAGHPLVLRVDEVDQMSWINVSVYLFKAPALYFALDRLRDDNAQREEYLTDVVPILSQAKASGQGAFRVQVVPVDDPNHVLSFNTFEELQIIEDYVRSLGNQG